MLKRITAFIIAITMLVGMTACSMPQDIFSDSIGSSKDGGKDKAVKSLYEFEFTMDGKGYYLPAQFDYFIDRGWSFEDPSANDEADADNAANETQLGVEHTLLNSGAYSDYIKVYHARNGYCIELKFYNDTPTTTNIGACSVVGMKLDALGSSVPFTQFDDEIQFGTEYNKIIDTYGEPSFEKSLSADMSAIASINDMSYDETAVNSQKCIYYYMTKHSFVEFTFGIMNQISDSLINIVIENDVDMEKEYDYKKDRKNEPDAVLLYKAPALLGQSINDFSFKYENNLYTLPIPVGELIDDGWEFARGSSMVVRSGTTEKGVVLCKGNRFIELMVHNYDVEKSQTPINCHAVSISASVVGPFVKILMPKGITLGSSAEDLETSYTTPFLNAAATSNKNQAADNLYELTEAINEPLKANDKQFINKLETDDYIMYSYVMPDDVPTVTIPDEIKNVNDPNKHIIGTYRKHIDVYVSKMNNKVVHIYMQNCPEFIVDEAAIWAEQLEQAEQAANNE